ncbi:hypothetical protein FXO37_09210 [Capsicum annuum]|nr:hypothetical protein FXO37_09210 [Capsicum annuum]
MESMFNEADVKVSFKNIEPTRKEISCFRILKKVVPASKKLKQQHKGLDEQTPKRTPPSLAAKKLSVRTPIFMSIQQKEKVASKKKDINRLARKKSIPIESPDSSLCSSGDEDNFVSKKVFHNFCNEKKDKDNQVNNPPMGEAIETTPHHEFSLNFVHDLYKNSKDTLVTEEINGNQSASLMELYNEDKNDVLNTKLVDDNIGEAHISDFQFSFSDKVLRRINLDFIKFNLGVEDESTHIDVCFYYLRKKSKYDPNTSYKYSTVDCNFMNIINSVLVVYRIDDDSLNAGGKEYHLNEYINGFRMYATVPWHTVDHIFISINVKVKHHWVLAVISFNDRCSYVYDSLSSIGHDAGVLAEVEKFAEVIPICLVACKFYEKKGIDTAIIQITNPMTTWIYLMFMLDCGLYMVTYTEYLTFGDLVSPVDFDPDMIRTRYASILWNYGMKKEEENAQSDDEAPMRPPREIGLTEDTEIHEI